MTVTDLLSAVGCFSMPTQWGQKFFKLTYLSNLLVSQITTPCRHLVSSNLTVGAEGAEEPVGPVGPFVLCDILVLSFLTASSLSRSYTFVFVFLFLFFFCHFSISNLRLVIFSFF